MAFTVGTEACTASLNWTGVEGVFAAGFPALDPTHIVVTYKPAVGNAVPLTPGIHFTAAIDGAGAVTVTPIAMPAAPGLVTIDRQTPAVQATNFINLASFSPDIHTQLHDAAAMRDAELRRDLARNVLAATGLLVPVQRKITATPYAFVAVDRELLVNFAGIVTINIGSAATQFAAQLGIAGPFDPLIIKDISGNANTTTRKININFTADTCDAAAALAITTPYGGWRVRPIQTGGWTVV